MSREKLHGLSLAGLLVTGVLCGLFLSSLGCQYGWIDETLFLCVACGGLNIGINDGGFAPSGWIASWNSELLGWWPFIDGWIVVIPLWMPILALGIPSFIAWRKTRGHGLGHCVTCGYNLTGNVSGACPECGTVCEGTSEQGAGHA